MRSDVNKMIIIIFISLVAIVGTMTIVQNRIHNRLGEVTIYHNGLPHQQYQTIGRVTSSGNTVYFRKITGEKMIVSYKGELGISYYD